MSGDPSPPYQSARSVKRAKAEAFNKAREERLAREAEAAKQPRKAPNAALILAGSAVALVRGLQ